MQTVVFGIVAHALSVPRPHSCGRLLHKVGEKCGLSRTSRLRHPTARRYSRTEAQSFHSLRGIIRCLGQRAVRESQRLGGDPFQLPVLPCRDSAPVAFDEDPPSSTSHPVMRFPTRTWPRTEFPSSGNPFMAVPVPAMVPGDPDMSAARRATSPFDPYPRGSHVHNHLSSESTD